MILGDTTTRVLLAVIRQDRPTVRSVAAETGICVSWTHATLQKLRAAGLVQWDHDKQATLRAMVAPTRTGVRYDWGTAHASGTGAALTAPAPWAARASSKGGPPVPDSTRTLSVVRGHHAS